MFTVIRNNLQILQFKIQSEFWKAVNSEPDGELIVFSQQGHANQPSFDDLS